MAWLAIVLLLIYVIKVYHFALWLTTPYTFHHVQHEITKLIIFRHTIKVVCSSS